MVFGADDIRALRIFEDIAGVPRPSGHEEKISSFVCDFLAERGIEHYKDGYLNVFARVPATPGRENEEPVLFQGHMDMVCEADTGVVWDPVSEGVRIRRDGDTVSAEGTSLGGDDGFGVAQMLAMADGACASHPPLELLFTTDEERGLTGASGFDMSSVKSRYLVNLDSESEDSIIVSCAGGLHVDLNMDMETSDFDGVALKITIDRLAGGHSGEDINRGRRSANRELAAVLLRMCDGAKINIAEFHGGTKYNAITRSAYAVIGAANLELAQKAFAEAEKDLRSNLNEDDSGMTLTAERTSAPEKMLTKKESRVFAEFLSLLPFGVLEMNNELGMPETSCNVGVADMSAGSARIGLFGRSASDRKLDDLEYVIEMLSVTYGAEMSVKSKDPGWEKTEGSRILEAYTEAYRSLYGKAPAARGIHAGLECGILKKKKGDLDAISIGSDMFGIHSPAEHFSVSSFERVTKAIYKMLEKEI